MIGRIFLITLSGFAIAAIIMRLSASGALGWQWRGRRNKLLVFFLIVHAVLLCAALGRVTMSALIAAILVSGGVELYRATARFGPAGVPERYLCWALYCTLAVGLVYSLREISPGDWIFLYLVVAGFDGFSQITGQWLGRRPLAPVVSPNKTVEGAVGGFVAAVVLAALVYPLTDLAPPAGLLLGATVAGLALCGDLSASWVKRRARIKDFGRLLPGQGGVLDRFDSFLLPGALAAPLFELVR